MTAAKALPRYILLIRWIARLWSTLIFVFVVMRVFTPDPYATEPIPAEDGFLLSLWGLAVLGLIIAWRWEQIGGIFTIAIMFFRELSWIILKGDWVVNFLIVWGLVIPPAILYLAAWRLTKKFQQESVEGKPVYSHTE